MKKIAFLFSGQGAQYPGMGKELYDNYEIVRNVLDKVNESVNFDLLDIIFNGPEEELNKTENTQPSILAISFAVYKLLESAGIRPQAMAGLSLGEYSALTASGVLQFEDAMALVKKRGKYMQEEVPEGKGGMAAIIGMDRENVFDIVKQASDFGAIDVLVNNAGITKDTLLMRMTEDQWDAVINVNLKSVFNFTKAAQKIMLKQKSGSIVNMSSVVGVSGNAGQSNYSASKAGIIGFTKSIAKELGSRGIRSNAIAPGFIITEMTAKIPEDARKQWEANIPMKRGGLPEEVAKVALFLASDLSSYVSGQVINVCGAMNT